MAGKLVNWSMDGRIIAGPNLAIFGRSYSAATAAAVLLDSKSKLIYTVDREVRYGIFMV